MEKTVVKHSMAKVLLCAVCAFGSQNVFPASSPLLRLQDIKVARHGGELVVSLDINPRSVNPGRDREVVFTPVVRSLEGGDSLVLPSVRVAGRNRYYSHLRNDDLTEGEKICYAGAKETLEYRQDIHFMPWIVRSRIVIMAMRFPEVLNEALKAMNRFCLLFVLSVTSIANARELPLPQVPAELRTAGERADYLLEHFWDRMDFTDASALGDTAFIEGSFANFASVMPHASKDGQAAGVARLMDAAKVSPVALSVLMKVAERYLYEPHSPVYCEECFEPFARYALANDLNAERMELLLEDMEQNAPGNAAPDLCLLSEGETVRLGGLFKSGIPSLLLFYDSGCDGCRRLIAALAGDEGSCRMVAQGRVNVIAVNLSGDGGKAPMSRIPSGWGAATACSAHEARDTYALRSTPALYLIGADGRIVLKNATLPRLGRYLRLNPGN